MRRINRVKSCWFTDKKDCNIYKIVARGIYHFRPDGVLTQDGIQDRNVSDFWFLVEMVCDGKCKGQRVMRGFGFWPTPIKSDGRRVAELKLHSLAKRCVGMAGNKWNFAEHVAAELGGYPTASFALSIMGFPPTWTDLEPLATP